HGGDLGRHRAAMAIKDAQEPSGRAWQGRVLDPVINSAVLLVIALPLRASHAHLARWFAWWIHRGYDTFNFMVPFHSPHVEHHFTGNETVRDIVLGMADGLTVPFALAAGLSGAMVASRIVVAAGIAEITAGAIAMGLGGYLAAKSDAEHYAAERAREETEVDEKPEVEAREVEDILQNYGLDALESRTVVGALRQRRQAWVDF